MNYKNLESDMNILNRELAAPNPHLCYEWILAIEESISRNALQNIVDQEKFGNIDKDNNYINNQNDENEDNKDNDQHLQLTI